MKSLVLIPICVLALLLALAPEPAAAQEAAPEAAKEAPAAVTVADPKVDVGELDLMLKPLTKEELEVEANAWLGLLKEKVGALTKTELEARKAEGDAKKALLDQAIELGAARTSLAKRVNTVVEAFKAKGGATEDMEKYISVVTGVTTDPTDLSALFKSAKSWLVSQEGGISVAIDILLFLVVVIAFKILAGILGSITRKAVNRIKDVSDLLRNFFVNTVRKVTVIIGFIIALSMLGIDIAPLLAGIGVVGFVIGFALQDSLANFASGIMLLIYRPYEIGDAVTAGGVTGKVEAMSLVSTTILTFDNQVEVVPNSSIWGGVITNITGNDTRRVDMTFGIGYSDDIAKAQGILEDILNNHPMVLKDPAYVIKLHELADSSVNFIVRPWSKTSDYWDVYWDVTRSVKERFDAEGVSIPFPQRDVHLFQESSA